MQQFINVWIEQDKSELLRINEFNKHNVDHTETNVEAEAGNVN